MCRCVEVSVEEGTHKVSKKPYRSLKTELSWWVFALAGILAMGIALVTVSWSRWPSGESCDEESWKL